MTERLLIKIDEEKFFRREVDPDKFEAALMQIIGSDGILEEVTICLGDDTPLGENAYDYLASTEEKRVRPKLLGIPGVERVLVFNTKPMPDPT